MVISVPFSYFDIKALLKQNCTEIGNVNSSLKYNLHCQRRNICRSNLVKFMSNIMFNFKL